MSDQIVRMVVLSTSDIDASIAFYGALGFSLKFRDGNHYAALDGGAITLALATDADHPVPGEVIVGIRTDDVDSAVQAVLGAGASVISEPRDDAHERRAVIRDDQGNGLVFYSALQK